VTGQIVATEPAHQRVVAGAANDAVVAAFSVEDIVAGIALDIVVALIGGPPAIAAHDVVAVAALDAVIAVAARQDIIPACPEALGTPGAGKDVIGIGITAEGVGKIAQSDRLDRIEDVALGIAGPGRRGFGEVDVDASGGVLVAHGIESVASGQNVRADAAIQPIITISSVEQVGSVAAADDIVVGIAVAGGGKIDQ